MKEEHPASPWLTCKLLLLINNQYASIIEDFHRVELQKNIQFLSELSYLRYHSYEVIESLAKWFNSKHIKKGEVLVKEGTIVDQMFIVKHGFVDVQKVIEIEDANYWPVEGKRYEWLKTSHSFK